MRRDGRELWLTFPSLPLGPTVATDGCARCGEVGRYVVLGLRWCEPCATVASFSLPAAPLTGAAFVWASCVLVAWMRTRQTGAWIHNPREAT